MEFWSSIEGVGSNPTSDRYFFRLITRWIYASHFLNKKKVLSLIYVFHTTVYIEEPLRKKRDAFLFALSLTPILTVNTDIPLGWGLGC